MSCRLPEVIALVYLRHHGGHGLKGAAIFTPYSCCPALYDPTYGPGGRTVPAGAISGQLAELMVVTVMGVLSSTLLPADGFTAVTLSVSLPMEVILSALTPLLVSFCR